MNHAPKQRKEKWQMFLISFFFLMAEIKNLKFCWKNSYPRKICLRSSKALLIMDIITSLSSVPVCNTASFFFFSHVILETYHEGLEFSHKTNKNPWAGSDCLAELSSVLFSSHRLVQDRSLHEPFITKNKPNSCALLLAWWPLERWKLYIYTWRQTEVDRTKDDYFNP